MQDLVTNFLRCLLIERNASPNTIGCYKLELERFIRFIQSERILDISDCNTALVRKYIYHISDARDLSKRSICRMVAILKSFFNFLLEDHQITL